METHDVTFENSQARERTQVLMDIANQVGGMVVGTGDLSELALGWATYNGDHMTYVRRQRLHPQDPGAASGLLRLRRQGRERAGALPRTGGHFWTPRVPELLPAINGQISQKTEDLVGPYELHDFFSSTMPFAGPSRPEKCCALPSMPLAGAMTGPPSEVGKTFYRRFFNQQFKRSCLPDGPKVGSVTLSPRGDWRMPSDAVAVLWLEELEALE